MKSVRVFIASLFIVAACAVWVGAQCGGTSPVVNYLNYIALTGQSNVTGILAIPALDTVNLYPAAVMYSSGIAMNMANDSTVHAVVTSGLTSLAPLVEGGVPDAGGYETIATSVVDNLNDRASYPVMMTNVGVGNQSLATICAGAGGTCSLTAGTMWNNLMQAFTLAKPLAVANNQTLNARAMMMIQGERDDFLNTAQSTYQQELLNYQEAFQAFALQFTPQTNVVPMFISQMANWTENGHTTSAIPLGQLAIGTQAKSNIYLVAPMYFLAYLPGGDGTSFHLPNTSERLIGEYFWQAYASVVQGGATNPNAFLTYPTSVSISSNVITVNFNVPNPPLVLDTTSTVSGRTIPTWTNDGFTYTDNSTPPSISSVALGGNACSPVNTCVQITLSGTPTATAGNRNIQYAYVGTSNAVPGTSSSSGGNLRDSNAVTSRWGYGPLYNWATTFNIAF